MRRPENLKGSHCALRLSELLLRAQTLVGFVAWQTFVRELHSPFISGLRFVRSMELSLRPVVSTMPSASRVLRVQCALVKAPIKLFHAI